MPVLVLREFGGAVRDGDGIGDQRLGGVLLGVEDSSLSCRCKKGESSCITIQRGLKYPSDIKPYPRICHIV